MSFKGYTETESWVLEMGWEDMTPEQKYDFCIEYQVGDELIHNLELKLKAEGL